ncbi:MAG: hypothetical protein O2779_02730 [Nanoarchaeota archaeon]|nr:hypothetical protein [Nanoarchaeota archaeon]
MRDVKDFWAILDLEVMGNYFNQQYPYLAATPMEFIASQFDFDSDFVGLDIASEDGMCLVVQYNPLITKFHLDFFNPTDRSVSLPLGAIDHIVLTRSDDVSRSFSLKEGNPGGMVKIATSTLEKDIYRVSLGSRLDHG